MTEKEQLQLEILEFQKFLVEEAKAKKVDPEQYVKSMDEKALEEAYARFRKAKTKKAQRGMKLNYLNSLKLENCKDDEELYFFKKGGSVGCGCKKKKKAQNGDKLKKLCGGKKFLGKGKKIKVGCHLNGGEFFYPITNLVNLERVRRVLDMIEKGIPLDWNTRKEYKNLLYNNPALTGKFATAYDNSLVYMEPQKFADMGYKDYINYDSKYDPKVFRMLGQMNDADMKLRERKYIEISKNRRKKK